MKIGRKGEIEVKQIVGVIIFIVGLAIVLVFVRFFNDASDVSDDVCHVSALTRATGPQALQSFVPLKCTTKKICLTMSSSKKCSTSFAGEDNIEVVTLPEDTNAAARVVAEKSAEAMYNCWSLLGEGKLNLFKNFNTYSGLGEDSAIDKPYCVVCSRVAIDESVNENVFTNSNLNLLDYMSKNGPAGQKLTYLQLFTDKQFSSYPVVDRKIFWENKAANAGSITLTRKEIALVFMQIKADGAAQTLSNLAGLGTIAAGGAFLIPPARAAEIAVLTRGGVLSKVLVAGGVAGFTALNAYSSQLVAGGYCGDLTGEGEKSKGCSIVSAVPYSASTVNQLCSVIDGNP